MIGFGSTSPQQIGMEFDHKLDWIPASVLAYVMHSLSHTTVVQTEVRELTPMIIPLVYDGSLH